MTWDVALDEVGKNFIDPVSYDRPPAQIVSVIVGVLELIALILEQFFWYKTYKISQAAGGGLAHEQYSAD